MHSIPEMVAALGISHAGVYELANLKGILVEDRLLNQNPQ